MTQIVCANCGQALRPTDKFCYNCGAKVQPIKMKPEVEKEVPKPETVKPAPSVFKTQAPVRQERPAAGEAAQKEAQEERPKFHMDEAMSWNTDGYPEAQRHPVQNPEEADFTWTDSTAQDRIRKRQEEGRKALYEEHETKEAGIEKAEAAEAAYQFSETPEAEEVVKAVDAESTIPVDAFGMEAAPKEAAPEEVPEAVSEEIPEAAPEEVPETAPAEVQEAEPEEVPAEVVTAEEAPAEEEKPEELEAPEESYRDAYQAAVGGLFVERVQAAEAEQPVIEDAASAEADDDYVVPTIESIEKDAEAAKAAEAEKAKAEEAAKAAEAEKAKAAEEEAVRDSEAEKARETEKEIFGYTLDDIDSGARAEGSSGAQVIDKFYTYSKKQEEFQALLDQENDKLKGSRPDASQPVSSIQEELDKVVAPEERPKEPIDTGGFVGVQLPETPESVEAYKAPSPEPQKEFLDGNFGKADDIARNASAHMNEDKTAAANTVAAAAGAVAAGAAAIAAAREKARAKVEAEKGSAASLEAPAGETVQAKEAPAAEEIIAEAPEKVSAEGSGIVDIGSQKPQEDKPFAEVITEESEKERERSLAEAAEEAARAKAAEIKAAEESEAVDEISAEEAEAPLEEAQRSINKVIEETAAPAEEEKKAEPEEDHKLTYQDVFNDEVEKTPKHTLLKIIAILILLLIILEVAAILIRRFAPDSAAGLQIQQIYEMIFNKFV